MLAKLCYNERQNISIGIHTVIISICNNATKSYLGNSTCSWQCHQNLVLAPIGTDFRNLDKTTSRILLDIKIESLGLQDKGPRCQISWNEQILHQIQNHVDASCIILFLKEPNNDLRYLLLVHLHHDLDGLDLQILFQNPTCFLNQIFSCYLFCNGNRIGISTNAGLCIHYLLQSSPRLLWINVVICYTFLSFGPIKSLNLHLESKNKNLPLSQLRRYGDRDRVLLLKCRWNGSLMPLSRLVWKRWSYLWIEIDTNVSIRR